MTADVPTLLLMIIVTSLVTSGALLVLNGNQRNDGLQYWAGGLLLSALAHTLLLLYGRIPNLLTVVLGNVLLSSALASFWLAVRRFHGLALHWARTLALLAAIALLMWLFQHQFASRVVVSGFTLSLQAALVLWVLRQRSEMARSQAQPRRAESFMLNRSAISSSATNGTRGTVPVSGSNWLNCRQ